MPKVRQTIGKGVSLPPLKPRQLAGSSLINSLAMFFNAFMKIRVQKGSGWDILISENNIIFQVPSDLGSGGGGGGTAAFKITDTFASKQDYFAAVQQNDDGSFSADTTYIAKHYKDRPSIITDTVNGLSVTYTYTDNFNRTTMQGSNSQKEQLFREPITGDKIICGELPFADPDIGAVDATWVDLTPRVWARKKDQS